VWERTRRRIMLRDFGLCQEHLRQGEPFPGNHVDHINPKAKGGGDEDSNLQTLCAACHKRKTIEENGGTFVQRNPVGVDGIPRGWK
jgi:5-methylcytosine-specific restriction protein A